jgi:signal transduction histidine kinase
MSHELRTPLNAIIGLVTNAARFGPKRRRHSHPNSIKPHCRAAV